MKKTTTKFGAAVCVLSFVGGGCLAQSPTPNPSSPISFTNRWIPSWTAGENTLLKKPQEVATTQRAAGMVFSVNAGGDPKKWAVPEIASRDGSAIMTVTFPEDDNPGAWTELSSRYVIFDKKLDSVDAWVAAIKWKGGTIVVDKNLADGSRWVEYTSYKENALWRYVQGTDGVYGISYQTRPGSENKDRVALWRGILEKAELVKNQ